MNLVVRHVLGHVGVVGVDEGALEDAGVDEGGQPHDAGGGGMNDVGVELLDVGVDAGGEAKGKGEGAIPGAREGVGGDDLGTAEVCGLIYKGGVVGPGEGPASARGYDQYLAP